MRKRLFLFRLKCRGFEFRQVFFLTLVIISLGITLLLAQPSTLSQEPGSKSPSWMSQVQQGTQFYQNQQYAEALQIWQGLIEQLRDDRLNRAVILSNLSLTYQQLGQWQEAEQAIIASRRLLETVVSLGVEHDRALAQTLDIQGRFHLMKGQPEQALARWQQSEQLYTHLHDNAAIAQSQINQAQALQNLGNYLLAQKRLTQATQILQQQSDSSLKATGLRSLGNVLRQIGDLKQSRENLEAAYKIAQRSQSPQLETEILLDLGSLEYSNAKRLQAIDRAEDAAQSTQRAQTYFQTVIQQANSLPVLQLRASLNDLSLLIDTKQYTSALKRFSTLPSLIESIPPGRFSIYARLRYVKQGIDLIQSNPTARQQIPSLSWRSLFTQTETALHQAQQLQDHRASAQALGILGNLYANNQQWSEAKQIIERALKLALGLMNAPDLLYELQWQMGQLLAQQQEGQPTNSQQAIAYYTNAIKALDTVRHNLMPANPDVQFSFRDQVEPVYRELVDLLLANPTPDYLKQSVEYIDALQLAELEDFLRCPVSRQVALDSKVDSHTALLHSIILPDRVVALLQRSGQPLSYHSTLIEQRQADIILQNLRANILKRNRPEDVLRDASQVYQWLIAPFESELEQNPDVKTLVFTLDGALRNIPIAALYDAKREEYLVQKKYATAFTPGLRLFELKPLQQDQIRILAAGISEARTVENRQFNEIANVNQELETIRTLFPAKVKQLLNSEFTETALREKIDTGAFTIAHLATHGAFSADPEATYILTFDQLIKSYAWNDLLKVNTQTTLKPFDLLVMSACETAKGDRRAILGLAGIAVRTGARSTISSLWKVDDPSTAKLMEKLYAELLKPNVTRAEALHRAQQTIFSDLNYNTPYYWAAFVLVGNWF